MQRRLRAVRLVRLGRVLGRLWHRRANALQVRYFLLYVNSSIRVKIYLHTIARRRNRVSNTVRAQ